MFGQAAEIYERSRPTYPPEAAAWLVPMAAKTALDVGAGTGKFTRSLVECGLEVIAVEPDPVMLATLAAALPGVRPVAGSAEQLPLADHSVDVVTMAQAWHWVDPPAAEKEIARVVKPGGTLGLVWNIRDERVDWVRELGVVMHRSEAESFLDDEPVIGKPFGPTERFEVSWSVPTTVDAIEELVASRSYLITAAPEERDRILKAVRELLLTHPDLAGRDSFELPYRTLCFKAQVT